MFHLLPRFKKKRASPKPSVLRPLLTEWRKYSLTCSAAYAALTKIPPLPDFVPTLLDAVQLRTYKIKQQHYHREAAEVRHRSTNMTEIQEERYLRSKDKLTELQEVVGHMRREALRVICTVTEGRHGDPAIDTDGENGDDREPDSDDEEGMMARRGVRIQAILRRLTELVGAGVEKEVLREVKKLKRELEKMPGGEDEEFDEAIWYSSDDSVDD